LEEGSVRDKEEFVQYLKHYRHDWLNDIQVIQGYLSLGKIDDVKRVLDQVIMRSHDESKVSQLGDLDLAYFLLTYNWSQDRVILAVEIEEDTAEISSIGKNYPYLLPWIKEITGMVEQGCDPEEYNRLLIVLSVQEGRLIMTVEFEGGWEEQIGSNEFRKLGEIVKLNQARLIVDVHNDTEFRFDIVTESKE
jgi:stage 0 sporulation protein B (sporulation initiation phosphotransferase)